MKVPHAFMHLAKCFYQGSDEEHLTMQHWIKSTLQHLDSTDRRVVSQFLTKLLKEADDADLQRLWNSTGADYYFSEGQETRRFLTEIRNSIE